LIELQTVEPRLERMLWRDAGDLRRLKAWKRVQSCAATKNGALMTYERSALCAGTGGGLFSTFFFD
jgi:hypothetical protein